MFDYIRSCTPDSFHENRLQIGCTPSTNYISRHTILEMKIPAGINTSGMNKLQQVLITFF